MSKFWILLTLFFAAEVILAFLFSAIAQVYYKKLGLDFKSIFKGILERLFLTVALINNITTALAFFGALKLGTRLKHEESIEDHNRFNDYYLLGNLASVTVAIFYCYSYTNLENLPLVMRLID